MSWLYAILLLVLLCLLAMVLLAEKCLNMVVKPSRSDTKQVRELELKNGFSDCVSDYEKSWIRHSFQLVNDGATLSGEIIENPAASEEQPQKVAIVCHGHTVNRYSSLKYAKIFLRAGFQVIIYDERYFGESTGDFCTLGQKEADDLCAVCDFARRTFGADCRIVLHGESMGAATVLLALAKETPALVIADCPFADTKLLLTEWITKNLHIPAEPLLSLCDLLGRVQYNYRLREVSPILAVEKSNSPICFMHGKDDSLISCEHSQRMYARCKNPKSSIYLYEGAEHAHSIIVDREGYEQKMLAFISDCMDEPANQA